MNKQDLQLRLRRYGYDTIHSKEDITFYDYKGNGLGAPTDGSPAVNVKVYSWPSLYDLAQRLGISDEATETASTLAFEHLQEYFWNAAVTNLIQNRFGRSVEWGAFGRSGGWLVLCEFTEDDVAHWNGGQLKRWAAFVRDVYAEIDRITAIDHVVEFIQDMEWDTEEVV